MGDAQRDAVLDRLIQSYLEKRRYASTARQLQAESQTLKQTPAEAAQAAPAAPGKDAAAQLLMALAEGGDPRQYAASFDRLAAWVDNSLDMFKPELGRVLYPLLVHSVLRLAGAGAGAEATALLQRHRPRFQPGPGAKATSTRGQELDDLQGLTAPEHLRTSRTAQAAQKRRYPVSLSGFSFQLLTTFLQAAQLTLPLALLNEHVAIQVTQGSQPADTPGDGPSGEEVSLLGGQVADDEAATNQAPLSLGLLQGSPEARFWQEEAEKLLVMEVPDVDEKGKPLGKKAKAAKQRALEREKKKREQERPAEETVEAEVPLLRLPEPRRAAVLGDLRAAVTLGPDAALPSAAFCTFVNTAQALTCAAFAPSGASLAAGFGDSTLRVYDFAGTAGEGAPATPPEGEAGQAPGGPAVFTLAGHAAAVYGLDFSGDEDLLFSASGDATVRLWSAELKACLAVYRGHSMPVWAVAAHPQGPYFASGAADHTGRVWSTEKARPVRLLVGHQGDVTALAWHPNGHYLATGSEEGAVRLWDLRDGACQRVFSGHRAPVTALAFAPRGDTVASGDDSGVVNVWDLAAAKKLAKLRSPAPSGGPAGTSGPPDAAGPGAELASSAAHVGPVWALAYSQGKEPVLSSGGADNRVRHWQRGGGADAEPYRLLQVLQTKATPVFALRYSRRNLLLGAGPLTLVRKEAG